MNEADFKRRVVAAVKAEGGYARRIEDKFSVGMPDMIIVPASSPVVFFVEAKIFIGNQFRPTERQLVELRRLHRGPAFGVVLGFDIKNKVAYASHPQEVIRTETALRMNPGETYSSFFNRLATEITLV